MSRGADRTVDARGLRCPVPYVKAKLALEEMTPGQVVLVLATDPEALIDLRALCEDGGHDLLSQDTGTNGSQTRIRRASVDEGPDAPAA